MKLFHFTHSVDVKEIGSTYPQSQTFIVDGTYHVDAPYSYRHLRLFQKGPKGIRFPKYKLHQKAKKTDLLTVTNYGYGSLIISDKFNQLLEDFPLPECEVFPFQVTKRDKDIPYNLIRFIEAQDSIIDFNQSEFEFRVKYQTEKEGIKFTSVEDYLEKKEEIIKKGAIATEYRAKKIYLNPSNHDLILFKCIHGTTIISERLANVIKENNITGVKITPLNEFKKVQFIIT